MSFFKNCWIISRKTLCLTFPNPHFSAVSLSPNIGISKKTAANTVHLSERTIPDSPAGKSPAIAETFF
jgi:hypothetical protein